MFAQCFVKPYVLLDHLRQIAGLTGLYHRFDNVFEFFERTLRPALDKQHHREFFQRTTQAIQMRSIRGSDFGDNRPVSRFGSHQTVLS